jgi:hypothetical protein
MAILEKKIPRFFGTKVICMSCSGFFWVTKWKKFAKKKKKKG